MENPITEPVRSPFVPSFIPFCHRRKEALFRLRSPPPSISPFSETSGYYSLRGRREKDGRGRGKGRASFSPQRAKPRQQHRSWEGMALFTSELLLSRTHKKTRGRKR